MDKSRRTNDQRTAKEIADLLGNIITLAMRLSFTSRSNICKLAEVAQSIAITNMHPDDVDAVRPVRAPHARS